ncbi:glycosyltransferase [Pseudoclavibacter sp. JSM 162008]|uniref:glycosyltransferase n=1 Tax=Pseudoclavibacter sp. JSM 162008 TaxID=3229855 RepID=UPI003523937F
MTISGANGPNAANSAVTGTIGYYVHHQGGGHARRALAIARECSMPVTGLSTLTKPDAWLGPWIRLERDDMALSPLEPTANGALHWAPVDDEGMRRRMARISTWIAETAPTVFVSDVSVEVAALARLHGVPVVSVALPGVRTDAPHTLGFGLSDAILAAWPVGITGMLPGVPSHIEARIHQVGAISAAERGHSAGPGPIRRVLVLAGSGGGGMTSAQIREAKRQTPGVEWDEIGTTPGNRVADPGPRIREASLVITHAGQGAIADVAAAQVPAIVVPQPRPHDEQITSARVLAATPNLPVIVAETFDRDDWAGLLDAASELDGRQWATWNDGGGALRAAALLDRMASR